MRGRSRSPRPPAATTRPGAVTRPRPKPPDASAAPIAPAAGPRLRVTSDVPGAFVFLDRRYVGVTPLDTTDVSAGTYQLKVSAEGVGSVDRSLDVAAGAPTEIAVALRQVHLDASVEVVHKHAMGSCEGRLSATPAGFAYATAHTGDAFTLPFPSVEAFEVDYLKKTLRLKGRSGKTWNFTTTAANADPLLVFERTVTDARRKLASR